jgi:hypothetical protein
MHDEEGPRRLRQGVDTPESLQRALTALRKGVDDSTRLARVGQKMEAVLDAPPSAAGTHVGSSARRGLWSQKSGALKLIVVGLLGGLGLLAPLLFFQNMDDATTVPASDRAGSPPQEKFEPQQAATTTEPTIAEPADSALADDRATEPAQLSAKRSPRSARASAARSRRQRESAIAVPHDTEDSVEKSLTDSPQESPAEAPKPAARPQPQPAAATTQEAPRPSEADLLLKARQALKREPQLALRLVSEHETLFVKGRLVPEREVLAIEALRNLGRTQEADERLKKFEASYPSSIHLQRLHEAR